jgi:hypothetical protein
VTRLDEQPRTQLLRVIEQRPGALVLVGRADHREEPAVLLSGPSLADRCLDYLPGAEPLAGNRQVHAGRGAKPTVPLVDQLQLEHDRPR